MKRLIPFHLLASLLTLIFLVSCGGGTTSAKLEVTGAFSSTGSNFPGGLIVHGENSTGKRVTIALDSASEKTVSLENGKWSFYAVGWSGSGKFTGTTSCGVVLDQDIQSNPKVMLEISSSKCSSPQISSILNVLPLRVLSCGTFHDYNSTTDVFTPVTATTNSSFCQNLPMNLQSPYTMFRIQASNEINNIKSLGFDSDCHLINSSSVTISIPAMKIPFTVKKFKTTQDCIDNNSRFVAFNLKNGISAGDPENFDHKTFNITGGLTHLFLPSGVSRRGNSPFINNIPRIKCQGGDCIPNLNVNVHASIPWIGTRHDQPLLKHVPTNACPSDVMADSKYFGISNCSIKDGTMVATINRNELSCQGSSTPLVNLKDIYTQSSKIYLQNTAANRIDIYSSNGEFLQSHPLTFSGTTIAVSPNGSLYLANGADLYVSAYNDITKSYGTWTSTLHSVGLISDMLFTDDGHFITLHDDGTLRSFAPGNFITPISTVTTWAKKIAYVNNTIYSINDTDKRIFTTSINPNGIISAIAALPANLPYIPNTIAVDQKHIYISYSDGDSYTNLDVYLLNGIDKVAFLPTALAHGTKNMVVANQHIYLQNYSVNALQSVKFKDTSLELTTHYASNECFETLVITAGDKSKFITLKSKPDVAFPVFDAGIEILGRRTLNTLDHSSYLFRDLNHGDEEYSTGGQLRRVQELLSSGNVSGLLPQYASCADLRNAISASGPITRSQSIMDPETGLPINVTVEVKSSTANLPLYICEKDTPTAVSCAKKYSLEVEFKVASRGSAERGKLLISCDQAAGRFESIEISSNKNQRELYLWNTESDNNARFEKYSLEKLVAGKRAQITVVEKDNGPFFLSSRSLRFENSTSNGTWANITEFEIDSGFMYTRSRHLSDVNFDSFFLNTSYNNSTTEYFNIIRSSPSFYGQLSDFSTSSSQVDPFANAASAHSFSKSWSTTSKGISLSVDAFSDLNSTAQTPQIRTFFTLSDP